MKSLLNKDQKPQISNREFSLKPSLIAGTNQTSDLAQFKLPYKNIDIPKIKIENLNYSKDSSIL